jgi:hypothetical protein
MPSVDSNIRVIAFLFKNKFKICNINLGTATVEDNDKRQTKIQYKNPAP